METIAEPVLAYILAGGPGAGLSVLSLERTVAAVPFAGKFRIIDFPLSNCTNSGVYNVAVLTQYRPHSLHDHIGIGRPWDLDRMHGGVRLLQPYQARSGSGWYVGTASAVYQNINLVKESGVEHVLILSGDQVCKMDYAALIAFHRGRRADVTVACGEVPAHEVSRYGILTTASDGRVTAFEEKPIFSASRLASMGVYVFRASVLIERLAEDAALSTSSHDFGSDILPSMVADRLRVFAYRFPGYWRDVGEIDSYWDANMEQLAPLPGLDLYDTHWPIYTRSEQRSAAKICSGAHVGDSLICHGCIIEGEVYHSILSPGVRVRPGAVVRDSILMTDTTIDEGAVVEHCIIDKEVVVGARARVGFGDDLTPNREEPQNLHRGITIVGKRARIPAGITIGRNCRIGPRAREESFVSAVLPSGEVVAGAERRLPYPVVEVDGGRGSGRDATAASSA